MLLGPFGFFPALAVAPAVFLADALDGLAERLAAGAQAEVPPPRGRTPSQAPGPSPAQVAFHRALPEVLARFAACEDSVCRREEAALLGEALSEHFALEEASGGFLADLVERAPELHESVRALEEEHGALLEALAPFAAEDPGVARPDRGSALRWVQRVQDHQRREDTLFERAYGVLLDGAAEA
ncbi:MAG: hypothetical protein D6731_13875 [Planctomycetota bacterium]|nr:MAG: hypothetical protein D6731_13875 [Planctomycetota bacterium]